MTSIILDEAYLLDQVEYPIPVVAEEEIEVDQGKETTYYEVWFQMTSGKRPYFWNVEQESLNNLQRDFRTARQYGGTFEYRYNKGFYLFNISKIEYIDVKKQNRKKNSQHDDDRYDAYEMSGP
jgi:hypothetical protein